MSHLPPFRYSPIDTSRGYQFRGPFGAVSGSLDVIGEDIRAGLFESGTARLLAENPDPMTQALIAQVRDDLVSELHQQSVLHIRDLRAAIARVAEREYDAWFDPDADRAAAPPAPELRERQANGRILVAKYWREGLGITYSDDQLGNATFQDDHPWSAALVSYVMRDAGAGDDFNYASSHYGYLHVAINNRKRNLPVICKAYRLSERTVEVGDIVVATRADSGATYDNPWGTNGKSHGDIITSVVAGDHVRTIGGNVHDNVDAKHLTIDATNHLTHDNYFAIVKWEPTAPNWL